MKGGRHGVVGNQVDQQGRPLSNAQAEGVFLRSLTPASSTYSKVTRRRSGEIVAIAARIAAIHVAIGGHDLAARRVVGDGEKPPGGTGPRSRPVDESPWATVEIVTRRALIASPSPAVPFPGRPASAGRLASGSPMPMTTTWLSRSPPARSDSSQRCSRIHPRSSCDAPRRAAGRTRTYRSRPACSSRPCGVALVARGRTRCGRRRHFEKQLPVPSSDCCRATWLIVQSWNDSASWPRSLGQVAHPVEVDAGRLDRPAANLRRPVARQSTFGEPGGEFFGFQVEEMLHGGQWRWSKGDVEREAKQAAPPGRILNPETQKAIPSPRRSLENTRRDAAASGGFPSAGRSGSLPDHLADQPSQASVGDRRLAGFERRKDRVAEELDGPVVDHRAGSRPPRPRAARLPTSRSPCPSTPRGRMRSARRPRGTSGCGEKTWRPSASS